MLQIQLKTMASLMLLGPLHQKMPIPPRRHFRSEFPHLGALLALTISKKKNLVVFAEGVLQVVEHRQETLSSNPSTTPQHKIEFSIFFKVNF
jgi:hypothetical protein